MHRIGMGSVFQAICETAGVKLTLEATNELLELISGALSAQLAVTLKEIAASTKATLEYAQAACGRMGTTPSAPLTDELVRFAAVLAAADIRHAAATKSGTVTGTEGANRAIWQALDNLAYAYKDAGFPTAFEFTSYLMNLADLNRERTPPPAVLELWAWAPVLAVLATPEDLESRRQHAVNVLVAARHALWPRVMGEVLQEAYEEMKYGAGGRQGAERP